MRVSALLGALALACVLGAATSSGGASASADGAAANPPVTIRLGEFFFKPRRVTVHVGQTVRFVNVGKIAHTVADTDSHGNVRSKLIRPRPLAHGQVQTVRFARPGTIHYLCTFHPTLMKGVIVVTR
jgi:plastocyanin